MKKNLDFVLKKKCFNTTFTSIVRNIVCTLFVMNESDGQVEKEALLPFRCSDVEQAWLRSISDFSDFSSSDEEVNAAYDVMASERRHERRHERLCNGNISNSDDSGDSMPENWAYCLLPCSGSRRRSGAILATKICC